MFNIDKTFQKIYDAEVLSHWKNKIRLLNTRKEKVIIEKQIKYN